MLIALWTRSLLAVSLQTTATPAALPHHTANPDSARVLRAARSQQASFEALRRRHMPRSYGSGGRCDVRIGRFCYWPDDGTETPRPAEPPRIVAARERLVRALDSLQRYVPGDEWIIGQRIRYLVEAGRDAAARATAAECQGDEAWCHSLEGYAFHATGLYRSADSAFALALAAMSPEERCDWLDPHQLVDDRLARRMEREECAGSDQLVRRTWWIAAPLYLLGVNDLRTEHLSRLVRGRIERHARSSQAVSWGNDLLELMMRYGWPEWYSRSDPPIGSLAEPSISGYDPSPSFGFFPSVAALERWPAVSADAWDFRSRTAPSRYAPKYMKHLTGLRHQLAVFRRGDSALVAAAFDARHDTAFTDSTSRAGLFLTWEADSLAASDVHRGTQGVLLARAPWRPLLGSIELLDSTRRAVARERYGITLPPRAGRIGVSDLLLFAPQDSTPKRLEDALPLALTTTRVEGAKPLGIFWETYGLRTQGEMLGVSVTVEEIDTPLRRRVARALRLMDRGAPLRVRWQEVPDRGTSVASRAVAVNLSHLAAGRYRVRLTVTPEEGEPVVATRTIEIDKGSGPRDQGPGKD